jgi:hypothetical protein
MTAAEIAEELNVPTLYVEEELEILRKGENGKYGLLRKLENGRYAINIVLWSKEEMVRANKLYTSRLSKIGDTIVKFIEDNREEYLSLPYLSRKRIEPIRFTNKISGLYFGKNPYNIDILSRIFPSSILTDLYP